MNRLEAERRPEEPGIRFGHYLPAHILTNATIASWNIQTGSGNKLTAEDIEKRTGITHRFVATTETPEDMAYNASVFALDRDPSFTRPDVVFASTSYPTGNNVASEVSRRLNIHPEMTLDIHAACSGFTRGLSYIKEHEEEFLGKRILFSTTEKYSPTLANLQENGIAYDPSLAQTIFSDGAYTIGFTYGKDLVVHASLDYRFPDNESQCLLMPIDMSLAVPPFITEHVPPSDNGYFYQEGRKVYGAIRNGIPPLIRQVVEESNLQVDDIKYVIPHQGSRHIVETLQDRLPEFKVYSDYQQGNFSSASIPKALYKAFQKGDIQKGDSVVLAGFGAGLFTSLSVVTFPK